MSESSVCMALGGGHLRVGGGGQESQELTPRIPQLLEVGNVRSNQQKTEKEQSVK